MSDIAIRAEPARVDEEAWKRAASSIRHPLARALLTLTFTTGLVDAVSYLGLGRVFIANMRRPGSRWSPGSSIYRSRDGRIEPLTP